MFFYISVYIIQVFILFYKTILCRLNSIICQFNPLVQQVAALRKKEFWYKQIVEIKCSNLRKAEAEVSVVSKAFIIFKLLIYNCYSMSKIICYSRLCILLARLIFSM